MEWYQNARQEEAVEKILPVSPDLPSGGQEKNLPPAGKSNRWGILIIVLVAVGSIAGAFLADGPEKIFASLTGADKRWLAAGAGCMLIYWALESGCLHLAARKAWPGQRLRTSVVTSMIGQLFNCITPFASGGQPIQAVFFSSAAGRTVGAVEAWGNSVDYLVGVESPEGEEVPNYHSQVVLTAEEVRTAALAQYPGADLSGDPSGWFSQTVENSAGGVASVDLGGVTLTGSEVRTLFGLRSASFSVSWDGEAFTFDVTGYGHGVGMSQYGANAMAREGSDFEEILTWYYTGTEVGELYGAAGG